MAALDLSLDGDRRSAPMGLDRRTNHLEVDGQLSVEANKHRSDQRWRGINQLTQTIRR